LTTIVKKIFEADDFTEGKEEWSVMELYINGKSKLDEFLNALPEKKQNEIVTKLHAIAMYGPRYSPKNFRTESNGIYAIVVNDVRLYCFLEANKLIIISHGIIKKRQKLKKSDLDMAIDARKKYLELVR